MSNAFSSWFWVVVFLLLWALGASVCCLLAHRQRQWHQVKFKVLQKQHQGLIRLLDGWYWQSDKQHRLIECIPPRDGSAPLHPPQGLLWDWLQGQPNPTGPLSSQGLSLQRQAEQHQDLLDVMVKTVGTPPGDAMMCLRASALQNQQGEFEGYIGILRPLALGPQTDAPAEPAEQASFSDMVSHDLRAPIRVVEGFARILKEDYGRVLDRIGNDHLGRILSAAARMNRMIDALLTLSQLSYAPLQNVSVNLSDIATLVIDELRRQSGEREVEVQIEPGMRAQGDPVLLHIVVENLLGNAWKYTSKTPHAMISFSQAPQSGNFLIRDNGAGFDMRFVDRLFGVFQRLHGINDFQGTGVGLASVRRIIRRHGGEIWARGIVNQGAEFYFSLPTLPSPSSQTSETSETSETIQAAQGSQAQSEREHQPI